MIRVLMEGVNITTEYGILYNSSALIQHRKLKNEDNYLCFEKIH